MTRNFITVDKGYSNLKIMTYNLLAQALCKREYFEYTSKLALKWSHRKKKLLDEICHYSPDIACFQEVDNYEEWWKPELLKHGYESVIYGNQTKQYSLSIFYKKEKFKLLETKTLELNDVAGKYQNFKTNNVALITAFDAELVGEDGNKFQKKLVIANQHLYWNPEPPILKLMQGYSTFINAQEFVKKYDCPFFFCGDFNSSPDEPLYFKLKKKPLIEDQLSRLTLPPSTMMTQDDSTLIPVNESDIKEFNLFVSSLLDNFETLPKLESAYSSYQLLISEEESEKSKHIEGDAEPLFTNFASWKGTIDYIFYPENQNIQLKEILKLPDQEIVASQTALPNDIYASDHLCLVANFLL